MITKSFKFGKISSFEVFSLKHVYTALAVILLFGTAYAGTFTAGLDVDTYVDSEKPDMSFADEDTLWAESVSGNPVKITYIGFINAFGNQGIFSPDQIDTATLKLKVLQVDKPGAIRVYFVHGYISPELTWNDEIEAKEDVYAEIEIPEAGEYTLDATDIIKEAVRTCTEGCPYGLKIVALDDTSIGLASSELSNRSTELKYVSKL